MFPYVISNYHDSILDLADYTNFRDLSKPMGAQTPERAHFFVEKYRQLEEAVSFVSNLDLTHLFKGGNSLHVWATL